MDKRDYKKIIINGIDFNWFNALHEESKEGWIWIPKLFDNGKKNVILKNLDNNKKIVGEARFIDENFVIRYNQSINTNKIIDCDTSVILNEYFRKLLFKKEVITPNIDLKMTNCWYNAILSAKHHPNQIVRITFWLAKMSVILSIISILISIIFQCCSDNCNNL